MIMEAPTQTFESICEWFECAANIAKANRKLDSAQLWQDGLDQLRHIASQRNDLKLALKNLLRAVDACNMLPGHALDAICDDSLAFARAALSKASAA
jgi:hypothetical protein